LILAFWGIENPERVYLKCRAGLWKPVSIFLPREAKYTKFRKGGLL
jgi:hypothetical protein